MFDSFSVQLVGVCYQCHCRLFNLIHKNAPQASLNLNVCSVVHV